MRDKGSFIEFRRVPARTRWIYVGNNSREEVLGIGTCKLVLDSGRSLLLEDVLYAPGIRRNLISVIALMSLGFRMLFEDNQFKIFMNSVYYGCGYLSDAFIIINSCYNNSSFSYVASTSNVNDVDSKLWHSRLSHIGKDRSTSQNRVVR